MLHDYLRPEAVEFGEWCLDQPLRFWAELLCQAIGATVASWRTGRWSYRYGWQGAILAGLVPALVWCYRQVIPARDPILEELRTCLAGEASFTNGDGILQAEPLACQMVWDASRERWLLASANLANRDITRDLLGEAGWARFAQQAEAVVGRLERVRITAELEHLREQTRQRESLAARKREADRLAVLQAVAETRRHPLRSVGA